MEKVLIVGGSGMLGRQIADFLSKSFEVIIFDRNKRTNHKTIQFDVLDRDGFEREFKKRDFKAAIHLVGSKSVADAEKNNIEEVRRLNLGSLDNLINSCIGTRTKIIFFSSAAVYGNKPIPHSETTNISPVNTYGKIKSECENFLLKRHLEKNISYNILRCFSVYSKYDDRLLIGKMFEALKNKQAINVSGLNQKRDFIHIDDLNEVIKNTINLEKTNNKIINVGSGIPREINEIVKIFEKYTKLEIKRNDSRVVGYDSLADTQKMTDLTGVRPRDIFEELKERLVEEEKHTIVQKGLFENKVICVTGGLGSIGQDITKGLLKFNPLKVIIADNRETELFYSKEYPLSEKIQSEFVDVRDYSSVERVLKGVDIVFHAAAMKHVIICEDHPFEAIKTNVLGTKNVIEASIKNGVEKTILISTDKAVNPTSVMGATKLLAEKLVGAIATSKSLRKNRTQFGIVRFGNVLYSRGSVLEIWNRQIKDGKKITITDGNMTRFFMGTSSCINLIFYATEMAMNGEIFILKMPSVKISDLAKAFIQIKGLDDANIHFIGVRKGEKMHEHLLIENDNNLTLENDRLFIKFPSYASENRIQEIKNKGFKEAIASEMSSNSENTLSIEEIKEILHGEKNITQE